MMCASIAITAAVLGWALGWFSAFFIVWKDQKKRQAVLDAKLADLQKTQTARRLA